MLKLATSSEFGSSDILTQDKANIADVVIASQPQTFMGGLLVVPSKERDWDNRRRAAYLVRRCMVVVHVGGTRCVTWSIDRIVQRHACITLGVEFIRAIFFIFFLYV
jgi:hypothetical protein